MQISTHSSPPAFAPIGGDRLIASFRRESKLLAYSSGNLGKNLAFGGADATILYLLTELFGVSGGMAGALMMIALAGDLIFDLLAALLVIRLRRSGLGYRWLIVAGAIPGGAAFALLYAVPALGAEQGWILALTLLVFRGAYAVIDVPHNALMSQVSADSRTRGRISGYRLFFSTCASVAVAAMLAPAVQHAAGSHVFGRLALIGVGWGLAFALTLTVSALASGHNIETRECNGDGLDIPVRDRLVLAVAFLGVVTGFAAPVFSRMLLHLGQYVIQRPDLVSPLLIAITAGQFIGVLVWTSLTSRYDKSVLLAAGHVLSACAMLLFGCCLAWPSALIACAVLIGVGLTCVFMLPWGILADLVDVVAWRHGRRMETGLFAAYLVVVKASGAASTAMIGWCLGWLGYVPGAVQPNTARIGMVALGLGLPTVGFIAAALVLVRFDIGHARHARLLRALDWRRRRAGSVGG